MHVPGVEFGLELGLSPRLNLPVQSEAFPHYIIDFKNLFATYRLGSDNTLTLLERLRTMVMVYDLDTCTKELFH